VKINIEIGDVVLDGVRFCETQALELRQALQSELTSLVTSRVDLASGARPVSLVEARVESTTNPSPRELGSGLARSISQSFREAQP
jgi:hypothetical protein